MATLQSLDELMPLMHRHVGICVSIYMPTARKGMETQQNQIRYKNMLRQAEERLAGSDLRPSEVKEFLAPAQEFISDELFWRNQKDGLALFLSQDSFNYFKIPQSFEELVVVSERFHFKPLIGFLSNDVDFYILAVSQNNIRLFECSRYQKKEVKLAGIPLSLQEALNLDDFEKRLQLHTGSEDTKALVLKFFQQIERGLREHFRKKGALLVFAGVEYLFPIYREATTYPHLLDNGIFGNPETLTAEELHEQAWSFIEPIAEEKKEGAIARYHQNAGTGLTSGELKEIVRSSYHGRVAVLFVPVGVQQWGNFNRSSNEVTLTGTTDASDEDLFDFAAIQTLLNGGIVYTLAPEQIPGGEPIAAVFRY